MKAHSQSKEQAQESGNNALAVASNSNSQGQALHGGLQSAFSKVGNGQLRQSKEEAHLIAENARHQGNTQVAKWAGDIWTVASNFQSIQAAIENEDMQTVKTLASQSGNLVRALLGSQVVDSDSADRLLQSAGGYWTMADESLKAASASSSGAEGSTAAQTAQNSQTIEQHRLPTNRGWAYCGIATSMMLLHANGKGNPEQRQQEMNDLVSEMYITGKGSTVQGMGQALRKRGMTDAKSTTTGTFSQLIQTLDAGQPVPFGITHMRGTVVKMNNQPSKHFSHLRPGDRHERTYGNSGHWVLVVGYEGPSEKPTHFILNDPDLGGQVRSTTAEIERMGDGNGRFFQVYQ